MGELEAQLASKERALNKYKKLSVDYEMYVREIEAQPQVVEDTFNPRSLHHINLSNENRTACRRKWLSDGGMAYVSRSSAPGCVDLFRFEV